MIHTKPQKISARIWSAVQSVVRNQTDFIQMRSSARLPKTLKTLTGYTRPFDTGINFAKTVFITNAHGKTPNSN
jgi:hypothetical protein